jgi:hypothetical protein
VQGLLGGVGETWRHVVAWIGCVVRIVAKSSGCRAPGPTITSSSLDRQAQLALLTDLLLHSNLFFLVFEDGETGKVKPGLLDHDTGRDGRVRPDNG